MNEKLGLLLTAFDDIDRLYKDMSLETAISSTQEGSSFAWTLAHVTNQVDAMINVKFCHRTPHPIIGQSLYRIGGSGKTEEWEAIKKGVIEVRETAISYLQTLPEEEFNKKAPYTGSYPFLKEKGFITLTYALFAGALHHYYHIGEVATKLDQLGNTIGNYPGPLTHCI